MLFLMNVIEPKRYRNMESNKLEIEENKSHENIE